MWSPIKNQKYISIIQLFLLSALLLGTLWLYGERLVTLAVKLSHDEDYSYGLLLPVVSLYITYLKWPQIRGHLWRPSWKGLVVLMSGYLLLLFGELATEVYTTSISFVVVLAGIVLLIGGKHVFRQLFFPIIILIPMFPLPAYITKKLTLPLQLISSRLAAWFLQLIGFPLVQHGNIIDLGVRQLQVVEACSGLRYILALLALGLIYCYFYQRRLWKAAILIVSLVPAAILANALRVAAMGILPALQEGFWHSFTGWLIFLFCFGVLLMISTALNYIKREPAEPLSLKKQTKEDRQEQSTPLGVFNYLLVAALGLTIIVGVLAQRFAQVLPVPLLQSFDRFPLQLGPWEGRRSFIDPKMFQATGADYYLNVDYVNPDNELINLWIAYYENQKSGRAVHSPFSCLAGGGWSVINSGSLELAAGHPVRYLFMDQSGKKMLVYYWYLQRGRWLTSEYLNKLYIGYDRLLTRRADGALVRLITPAEPNLDAARYRLEALGKLLIPLLPQFIKN